MSISSSILIGRSQGRLFKQQVRCFQCNYSILNYKIVRNKFNKQHLTLVYTKNYELYLKEIEDLSKWTNTFVQGLEDFIMLR